MNLPLSVKIFEPTGSASWAGAEKHRGNVVPGSSTIGVFSRVCLQLDSVRPRPREKAVPCAKTLVFRIAEGLNGCFKKKSLKERENRRKFLLSAVLGPGRDALQDNFMNQYGASSGSQREKSYPDGFATIESTAVDRFEISSRIGENLRLVLMGMPGVAKQC